MTKLDDIAERTDRGPLSIPWRKDVRLLMRAVRQLGAQSRGIWRYAQHIEYDCSSHTGYPDESAVCTCGFDALREQVDPDVLELIGGEE